MPTFITIPQSNDGHALVAAELISSIEEVPGAGSYITATGFGIDTTLTPTEVLDLIEAAMHPTTETETR